MGRTIRRVNKKDVAPEERDPLADALENALLKSGKSATAFCYAEFGDPAFMTRVRGGRLFRPRMREHVLTVLEKYKVQVVE